MPLSHKVTGTKIAVRDSRATRESSAETSKDEQSEKMVGLGGNVMILEGVDRMSLSRVLPYRLTHKTTIKTDVGKFFKRSKQRWQWIMGWGSDNLAVVFYNSRSGRKRLFINGDIVLNDKIQAKRFRFETTVTDRRAIASNPPLAVVLTLEEDGEANLWLDGINVKSLRRGSLYEKGSAPPLPA